MMSLSNIFTTYLGCKRDPFCLFLDIPFGARITLTPPASAPRKNPASPLARPWPGCFLLEPVAGPLESLASGSSAWTLCVRSMPRLSASLSARSRLRSIPVIKLKSRSNADSVASSLRFKYAAGSRTPEHCDQSLWRRVHGREHVRVEQRGHRYLGGLTWLQTGGVR